MKIKSFYRQSRCEKIAGFEKLIYEKGRYDVLRKATQMFCSLLVTGMDGNEILRQIQWYLKTEYEKLVMDFTWQSKQYVYDTFLYRRALRYLQDNYSTFLKASVLTSMDIGIPLPDGSQCLEGEVSLILQDEKEVYHAIIMHSGSCSRSVKGKTVLTTAATDLHCMVAKYCLEKNYPGIVIHPLYLTHKADTPMAIKEALEVSDYASSNVHSLSYSDYYMEGTDLFDYGTFQQVIGNVVDLKGKDSCYGCRWATICKTPLLPLQEEKAEKEVEKTYHMPSFTKEQLQVIHHNKGALRVCAGPGSGKTATLIGRIRYLVEECKVHPQFILVVTFTNEAAQELKNRCLSFLEESNLPKIATLNSFCYGILRENQDLLEKELKILSTREKMRIVQNIESVTPPLTGFKYGQKYGDTGLYKTLCNRLDKYFELGEFAFFQKYPEIGNDFKTFAARYQEVIESHDYITFDEQISMCNQLFADYPEVLNIYSSIYQYVMVDEYQDVNDAQVSMLYSVASHGNIVVVGDDDQSIYGFRGASASFMIHFPDYFPDAKTVIFKDNFRSTKKLVDVAQKLISNNAERISKDIRSGKGVEGVLPVVIPSMDAEAIDTLITNLVSEGYRYEDIAILSTKNAPLEDLHSSLQAPTVLAKSYLREDGFFVFVRSVLQLHEDMGNDKAFLQYMTLMGLADKVYKKQGMTLYEAILETYQLTDFRLEPVGMMGSPLEKAFSVLSDVFTLLDKKPDMYVFLTACKHMIDWHYSDSLEVLTEQLEKQGVTTLNELLTFMNYFVDFQDETRVEVDNNGKVTLITCHDAKGKEYPVVLIRNDFSSFSEEVRRVFYVAVTRAKEKLYMLQEKTCKVDFLKEIPCAMEG